MVSFLQFLPVSITASVFTELLEYRDVVAAVDFIPMKSWGRFDWRSLSSAVGSKSLKAMLTSYVSLNEGKWLLSRFNIVRWTIVTSLVEEVRDFSANVFEWKIPNCSLLQCHLETLFKFTALTLLYFDIKSIPANEVYARLVSLSARCSLYIKLDQAWNAEENAFKASYDKQKNSLVVEYCAAWFYVEALLDSILNLEIFEKLEDTEDPMDKLLKFAETLHTMHLCDAVVELEFLRNFPI